MGTAKERGVEMRSTENYELNLLDAEDFVNREVLNENTEKIDEVLKTLEEPEHDTTKQTEVEELESGESLKVALRKLAKAVADYISHKADQVAHITAAERTVWNAKLGAEKIAANLTTTEAGMLLDATMGKQLAETDASLQEQISTLNSNFTSQLGSNFVKVYDFQNNGFDIASLVGSNYGLHLIRVAQTAKPSIGIPTEINQWGTLVVFNCAYRQILYISQHGEIATYGMDTRKWKVTTMTDGTTS